MAEHPSRFGPYQVISPLGAGGMGQVYRARDTRLQRFVAIKLLHDAASLDPDRQRRFAQEAVAASALNHPNILTVYDVGAEADTQYLVSELIDGESLRAEMNRGRVPLRRAIEIAHQVAEGLAAAHDAGIVHRDLKPENVMVTADSRVKIVDFGLAKTPDAAAALAGAVASTQTAEGLILGTVPYMSPEQARGGQADFRSDQFALGVILYELTTGAHPFKRDTAVQTLSAIIAEEPPDASLVAPTVPVAVRWVIRRLLAKNPRQRFANTADLASDLRTIREYLSEALSGAAVPVSPPRSRARIAVALAAAAVAAAAAIGWWLMPATEDPAFDRFTPFATDAGYQSAPSWSPDGTEIAYEAELDGVVQIVTRKLGSATSTPVTHSIFDCKSPVWSADGYIYYHSAARDTDALWRVSPVGGNPQMIIEGASQSTISPDGKTVFFLRDEAGTAFNGFKLWSASLPDAKEQKYSWSANADGFSSSGFLKYAPDGSKVLLWIGPDSAGKGGFWELPVPQGTPRALLREFGRPGLEPSAFTWLPDSRHIILTRSDGPTPGTHLWVADTQTSELRPLTKTPGNEGAPEAARSGRTVAFTWEATDFDLFEVPVDGSGLRPFLSSTRNEYDPASSPANTQFAFVSDRTGAPQIWLQNQEGYLHQPLVTEADFGTPAASAAVGSLAFSPDGTKLAFQRAASAAGSAPEGSRIWVTSLTGGKPVALGGSETFQDAPTWSPDGDWIAYLSGRRGDVALVKTQVGSRAEPVRLSKESIPPFVSRPQWSPNGEWILCEVTGGLSLIAADGRRSRVISDRGWLGYAWDADSRHIHGLRISEDQHHFLLVSLDTQTGTERAISTTLGTIPQALQPIRGFSRLRNGGFLTSIARVRSDIYLIEGFRLPLRWWERLWRFGQH